MKPTKRWFFAAACLLAAPLVSNAADDALLNTLVEKGYLTDSEAQQIRKDTPVVEPAGRETRKLRINGMLQFQYQNMSGDYSGPLFAGGTNRNSSENGFYFRRLFLGAQADLAQNLYGKLVIDFGSNNNTALIDHAFIGWNRYEAAKVRFGWTKVPFGYEETQSATILRTVERSIANRLFADQLDITSRHQGIFVDGDLSEWVDGLSYATSFTNNTQARQSNQTGDSNAFAWFGRVEYETDIKYGDLLMGVDLGYVQDIFANAGTPVPPPPATRPLSEGVRMIGVHGLWNWDKFRLFTEFQGGEASDVKLNAAGNPDDAFIYGYVIRPSYRITDNIEAVVSYAAVNTNGTYQARAATLVSNSNAFGSYDDATSWYIGGNWYLMDKFMRVSGGYEYASFESTGPGAANGNEVDVSGVRVQMQLIF